jgi:hypothetical protein
MTSTDATPAEPTEPQRPIVMLGIPQIAEMFGVERTTVSQWRTRYAGTHPIPVPDVEVGSEKRPVSGWHPDRADEWREWHRTRPGEAGRRQDTDSKVRRLEDQLGAVQAELRAAQAERDRQT